MNNISGIQSPTATNAGREVEASSKGQREARIAALTQQVRTGTYVPDAGKIAEAMRQVAQNARCSASQTPRKE